MADNYYGFNKWLQGRARFEALANRNGLLPRGFQRPEGVSDPYDFTDRYNTQLTPQQETQYQEWLQTLPEYQRSTKDYDLRGYFLAGLNGEDGIQLYNRQEGQHFIDRFKKPNHPTFSNQSMYHGVDGFVGGTWIPTGGKLGASHLFVVPENGTTPFSKSGLQGYMLTAEAPTPINDPVAMKNGQIITYDPESKTFVNNRNKGSMLIDNRAGDYYNDNIGESTIHPEAPNKGGFANFLVGKLQGLSDRISKDWPVRLPTLAGGTRG